MGFNLASLDTRAAADAGVWLTLTDIHGNDVFGDDGEPVQFLIVGRDSAIAKEAFRLIKGKEGEALEGAALTALAKCVKGWSDNLDEDFTDANVRKALEIPHVQEWAMKQVLDRANFTTKG